MLCSTLKTAMFEVAWGWVGTPLFFDTPSKNLVGHEMAAKCFLL